MRRLRGKKWASSRAVRAESRRRKAISRALTQEVGKSLPQPHSIPPIRGHCTPIRPE